jgi:hypothetical protein
VKKDVYVAGLAGIWIQRRGVVHGKCFQVCGAF